MGACIAPEVPKGPPAQVISSPPADYTGRNNYQKSPTMASSINTVQGQQLQQIQQNQQYQQQPFLPPPQQNTDQTNLNHQDTNNIDFTTTIINSQQQNAAPSAPPSAPPDLQQSATPSVKDRIKTPTIPVDQQRQSSDEQNDHNNTSRKATPPPQPPPPQVNEIATNETNHNIINNGNDSGDDDEEVEAVDVNEEVVKQYMSYEEQIIRLKKTYSHQKLDHSFASMKALEDSIQQATKKLEDLKRQTVKEYNDIIQMQNPSVKALFINQAQHVAAIDKEQHEYVDALNRQEVADKELDALKQQHAALQRECQEAEKGTEELKKLRDQQSELLERIFNGKYGSEKEYRLELDLEMMEDRKQRVAAARYRWQCARFLLNYATNQLNFAVKRWHQLRTIHQQQFNIRYKMIAETRNNLIASLQNINNAYRYLPQIQLPYVGSEFTNLITLSINAIFNDAQNSRSYEHFQLRLNDYFKKCSHLNQWSNQVLTQTIDQDFRKATNDYNQLNRMLRDERLRLLEEKARAIIGADFVASSFLLSNDIDDDEGKHDDHAVGQSIIIEAEPVPQSEEEVASPEQAPPPPQIDVQQQQDMNQSNMETSPQISDQQAPEFNPVPLSDLAPPPTQEELFGNIENLRKKHEEDVAEFERIQNYNRQRTDQGLQEKLRSRRSRRRKQQMETIQGHILSQKVAEANEPRS